MALLAGEALGGGESAQAERVLVPQQVSERDRGAAVAADGDELHLLVEDHAPRFGDRLFDADTHVGGGQGELLPFHAARRVRFIHRHLEAGADGVGLRGEAAPVHVDQSHAHLRACGAGEPRQNQCSNPS